MKLVLIWACALIIFGIMEAVSVSLISIWFAGGSLVALIAAACGAPLWLQCTLFLVVSCALILALRPFARRFMNTKDAVTNVDANIGRTAVVIERIDNLRGTGRVMIGAADWTARSVDDSVIEAETLVRVERIEGVKVCVARVSVGAAT